MATKPCPGAGVGVCAGFLARASAQLVGGIVKRSLAMVERAVRFAIPNSCGVEAATPSRQNSFTDTGVGLGGSILLENLVVLARVT
jgi:hypothetical protein